MVGNAMRKWLFVVTLGLGAACIPGTPVVAADDRTRDAQAGDAPAEEAPGKKGDDAKRSRISLEDAKAIVRQAYGGRVLSADAAQARPAPKRPKESGFRVRVDVDGRVKTVFVDARGRIHEDAEF